MKVFHKITAFLLLMLFASETFGVSRYHHFCGDEITTESFFIQDKDCCCEEEEEAEMSGCCKDEIKVVQNTNSEVLPARKSTDVPSVNFITVFSVLNSTISIEPIIVSSFNKKNLINQSFDTSPPIRELACCFII